MDEVNNLQEGYETLLTDYQKSQDGKNSSEKSNTNKSYPSTFVFKDKITLEVKILSTSRCTNIVDEDTPHNRCITATLIDEVHNTPFVIVSEDNHLYSSLEMEKYISSM